VIRDPEDTVSSPLPYSIPAAAPLYPPPPYRYRDCPLMVIPFTAGPGVIRRLVPEPLEPNPDDLAYVAIGHLHNDRLGSTHEAFIVVPSSDGTRVGNFAVFLYLENDACVTSGREIWGWPKKLAEIDFAETPERAEATVRRGGADLIAASVAPDRETAVEDLGLSPVWFNLKIVPSVVEGAPPDVLQLTATTFADLEVRDARSGRAELAFGSTGEDPLAELMDVREVASGHRMTMAFRLLHGEVVHDYLGAGAASGREALVAAG
jgi:acetoacetate decarboxylase